jgi:anti-anti-sigma factor
MLNITRKPLTDETEPLVFALEGNIDAHAAESLQTLYTIPPSPSAHLDFAGVQRINSMGLALLLKLFEHCETQGVSIKVSRANRMTSMLFKMINLDHYLDVGHTPKPPPPLAPKPIAVSPPTPTQPKSTESPHTLASDGKLVFLANMQNSQQLNGWYFFNTYLQRRMNREIHLDLVHAAWDNSLQPAATHLVFAKPFQATKLLLEHNYHLAARPSGQADEVTLLVRADDERRELAEFAGSKVVTDIEKSFIYLLGRFLLDESGLPSDGLSYIFAGHEIKAVRTLLNGEADLLFLPTDSYNGLSPLTRSRLRALDASDSGLAFHAFCVAPGCATLLHTLRSILLEMPSDNKGQQVLEDLGVESWNEPEREEIDMLTMLYQRYSNKN